jgi:hypothetical protein
MQSGQLGSDQISGILDVSKSICGRNGKLGRIIQSWIMEVTFAVHFNIGDESIWPASTISFSDDN